VSGDGTARRVDEDFRGLPLDDLAQAALQRAADLGAGHADLRVQRMRESVIRLRDGRMSTGTDGTDSGLAVRVLVDGVWGFASGSDLSVPTAVRMAEQAVEMARVSRPLATEPVELADEPVHAGVEWVSSYSKDPFELSAADRAGLLAQWSADLLADPVVDHVDAGLQQLKEQKFYADLAGTRTLQQRVMLHPEVTAVALAADGSGAETMRTLGPTSARGWEYLEGDGWDWAGELARLPEKLRERLAAPSVEPGQYDLVIDPSNLFLTIHESVGHATELDRALGFEAAYAGTSFATVDRLGTLRYGSDLMNVTGDRTMEHGCATIGYDDEGVATRQWDIVSGGTLVGYQLDRRMARTCNLGRSNGCAYADSAAHVPVQRMANVSLQAAPDGPSTEQIIAGVERGIYIVGDKSWSIDMQRYNFQFTGQRFYLIRSGRLAGQVKDVAYQASTPRFWGALTAVGGRQTYYLGGAPNCGKGQPGQTAWVSHGCPTTMFTGIRVLNTRQEGGQ
jgi:TldD protein